jgi:hypothetical protein
MKCKKKQKIHEKNRASKLEGGGDIEGFQTSVCLRGRVGEIYLARDVQSFYARSHSGVENWNRRVHGFVTMHTNGSFYSFYMRRRW